MPSLQFREEKATQVAARFLQLGGGRMNLMKLVKLIYLADREALVRSGRPITMDYLCSLRHGPIVSNIYNLINDQPDPDYPRYWHRYITERQVNYDVELSREPGIDQLSKVEEQIIADVFARHGAKDQWQLRDYTHSLPEWHDPGTSMLPIQIREILLPAGYSEEDVAAIESELTYVAQLERALR